MEQTTKDQLMCDAIFRITLRRNSMSKVINFLWSYIIDIGYLLIKIPMMRLLIWAEMIEIELFDR